MQSAKRAAAVAAAALTSSQQSEPLARFLQISPDHQGGIAVRIKGSEVRVTHASIDFDQTLDETGGLRVSSKHFSLRLCVLVILHFLCFLSEKLQCEQS